MDNEKAVLSTWQGDYPAVVCKRYETSELNFVLGIPGDYHGASQLKIPKSLMKWVKNFMKHKAEIELFPHIEHTIATLKSRGWG